MNPKHCVIFSTNKWFSAVNEYAWQLALALDGSADWCVQIWSQPGGPLIAKAKEKNLVTQTFAMRSVIRVLRALFLTKPDVLYVFEGHEHTVCAIFKFLFAWKFRNVKLVRLRGQDREVRNTFLNRFLDIKLTDRVIYVSKCVKDRTPFAKRDDRFKVFPLCMNNDRFLENNLHVELSALLPEVKSHFGAGKKPLVMSMVARFDPVKGHNLLFAALHQTLSEGLLNRQILFFVIGRSENISLLELKSLLQKEIPGEFLTSDRNDRAFFTSEKKIKEEDDQSIQGSNSHRPAVIVCFFDHKIESLQNFHALTDLGMIPSLGSEVICRVALEFFAAGVPVLSSKAGSLAEIVTPEVGFNFVTGDVVSLHQQLTQALLLVQSSSALISEMKGNCRKEFLDKYRASRFVDLSNELSG